MRPALFGFLAGVAAFAGTATVRAEEKSDAFAAVEIVPAKQRSGAAALIDDPWIAGLLERATWRGSVVEAAKSSRLMESPEFKGMSASEIGWTSVGSVTVERRESQGIAVVRAAGGTPAQDVAVANAVANWLVETARAEAEHRRRPRRERLETTMSQADAQIRLLTIDKTSALRDGGFSELTFAADVDRLVQYRRMRANDEDQLRRELANDEDTYVTFKSVFADGGPRIESLASHPIIARDGNYRSLDDAVRSEEDARADLVATGLSPSHGTIVEADRKIARARAARDREMKSIVTVFVRDHEGRRARMKRAAADVSEATLEVEAALALKRVVDEKEDEIARHRARKRDAIDALEEMRASDESFDAIRVLTAAALPPTTR